MLRMTPLQQDRLDAALSIAQEVVGFGVPRWALMEAICQEWLGIFAEFEDESLHEDGKPVSEEKARAAHEDRLREWTAGAAAVGRQLDVLEEASSVVDGEGLPEENDGMSLDARLKRLMEGQKSFDEPFGRLAEVLVRKGHWIRLGYLQFEEYCRERLGMAARTVRQRVWLERQMCAYPEIREALASGELTFSKALLVAKDAGRGPLGGGNVTERIRDAASTTCQQVEQKSTEAEDRRNRAAGVRKLWS